MHRRRFVCKQNKQPWLNSCNQLSSNSPLGKQHLPAPCLIHNSCFLSSLSIFKSSIFLQKQKTNRCQFCRHPGCKAFICLLKTISTQKWLNTNELSPASLQTLIHVSRLAKSTQITYLQGSPPAWTGLQAKEWWNLESNYGFSLICIPLLSYSVMLSRCILNVLVHLM